MDHGATPVSIILLSWKSLHKDDGFLEYSIAVLAWRLSLMLIT